MRNPFQAASLPCTDEFRGLGTSWGIKRLCPPIAPIKEKIARIFLEVLVAVMPGGGVSTNTWCRS